MDWIDETEGFVAKRDTAKYEIAAQFLEDAGAINEQLGDEYRLMKGDSQALRNYLDAIAIWHRKMALAQKSGLPTCHYHEDRSKGGEQ